MAARLIAVPCVIGDVSNLKLIMLHVLKKERAALASGSLLASGVAAASPERAPQWMCVATPGLVFPLVVANLTWGCRGDVCEDMGRAAILLGGISFNAALYAARGLACVRWDVPGNGVPTFYKRDCSEARAENGLCGVRQLPESWSYTGVRADGVSLAALSTAPGGGWTSVLSWLRQLQLKGLQANAVPFRTCVATAGWPEALQLATGSRLREELVPTLRQRLSEDGHWRLAISSASSFDASPVTVAVLSSSCVRGGSWSDGLEASRASWRPLVAHQGELSFRRWHFGMCAA
ncbi:rsmF [Symbiodinium necroappetens]|uniref:RsmF protein n=1 Tax=Symbiodinium necroappetens TaxID=1628268 RepID=A0A812RAU6_9DINO|nr:rsmF [Symbiodinium necroappetens]